MPRIIEDETDFLAKEDYTHDTSTQSLSTLYRIKQGLGNSRPSRIDPSLGKASYGTLLHVPPGLEVLTSATKMYLNKRLDLLEMDLEGSYKCEIINEEGNRIFLVKSTTYFDSDEVIHYGKFKKVNVKGKFCYGVVNYSGTQVFQIYGDPERVIRIGPSASLWGEVQVIPGRVWDKLPVICSCLSCYYCCHCCRHKTKDEKHVEHHHEKRESSRRGEAEIRVIVLKKDMGPKPVPGEHWDPFFKHVYSLRGKLSHGCYHQLNNVFYKKNFDLKIYDKDIFKDGKGEDDEDEDESTDSGEDGQPHHVHIGRFRSNTHHEKLNCPLPTLELPRNMDVYDKITLMGLFFLFSLKV